jgi:hypothetical protein
LKQLTSDIRNWKESVLKTRDDDESLILKMLVEKWHDEQIESDIHPDTDKLMSAAKSYLQ